MLDQTPRPTEGWVAVGFHLLWPRIVLAVRSFSIFGITLALELVPYLSGSVSCLVY